MSLLGNPNRQPEQTLSTSRNSSDICRATCRRVALVEHLSPPPLLTCSASIPQADLGRSLCYFPSPLLQILAFTALERKHLFLLDHELTAGEIIHVFLVSSAVIVGLESHFAFLVKCIWGSWWEHKEPG